MRSHHMTRYLPAAMGFTLIELMIVLVIAAIVILIGAPQLSEFVASQRVRTASSDLAADIALARAKAIEQSRRVYIQRTGAAWINGWRIFVDRDNDNTYDAGEEVKVFEGFPAGNLRICTIPAAGDFATGIIFRPDGRVVRTGAPGANDGIYIIDALTGDPCDNKIRGLLFGASGRATTVPFQRTNPPACPELTPPC